MDSLINFRDIGNIPNTEGKLVKPRLFLRSGEVVKVKNSVVDKLRNDYQLKRIIDFRGADETSERPDDTIDGVDYVNIDILQEVNKQGAGMDDFLNRVDSAEKGMFDLYEELALSKKAQKGYQEFLEGIIANPNTPTLFHCFAGKDRTGFAAALILKSLGVSDKLVMKDYLKTNEMRKKANQEIICDLREKGLTEEELEGVLVMLNVDQRYLEHSFELINKEFGTFEDFMSKGLRMPNSFVLEMKQAFTV